VPALLPGRAWFGVDRLCLVANDAPFRHNIRFIRRHVHAPNAFIEFKVAHAGLPFHGTSWRAHPKDLKFGFHQPAVDLNHLTGFEQRTQTTQASGSFRQVQSVGQLFFLATAPDNGHGQYYLPAQTASG